MLSVDDYYRYYSAQAGGGINDVFRGTSIQHGRGLGNILGSIFRIAKPFLPIVAKGLFSGGMGLASDLMSGVAPKKAFVRRGKQTAKNVFGGVASKVQRGSGKKGYKRKRNPSPPKKAKQAKREKDCFDKS